MNIFKLAVSKAAVRTPFFLQRSVTESMANRMLSEPLSDGDLDFLDGRFFAIRVQDFQLEMVFSLKEQRILLCSQQKQADVTISSTAVDFTYLVLGQVDPDTLFFQRRLNIEGDVELGLGVKNILDSVGAVNLPAPLLKIVLAHCQLLS